MTYRFAVAAMTCALAGCVNVSPLPFAKSEQQFGYQGALLSERASAGSNEAPAAPRQPRLAIPDVSGVASQDTPALAVAAPAVSRQALPPYDESKDPYVTAVLLPDISADATDDVYRKRPNGTIMLPPPAHIPVIETADVREALLAGSHEVLAAEMPATW